MRNWTNLEHAPEEVDLIPAICQRRRTGCLGNPMRSIATAISVLLGFWFADCFCALQGQEVGCPDYYSCSSDTLWSNCRTTGHSTNTVDLDLDGKQDFRLINRNAGGNRGEQIPHLICGWRDETQALFAEPHVQMYLSKETWEGCAYVPPEARLTQGQTIPAKPAPDSTWEWIHPTNVARLKGIGFGWTKRILTYGNPLLDEITLEPGYLQHLSTPKSTNVLFGLRIQREDGWHLGWLRVHLWKEPTAVRHVSILESSVNPVPDQDVVAGVRAGTVLAISPQGTNSLQLSWSTNATNMVLEQKLTLSDPAWTVVAGVTNNQYAVAPTKPASIYRLRGQ